MNTKDGDLEFLLKCFFKTLTFNELNCVYFFSFVENRVSVFETLLILILLLASAQFTIAENF